MDRVSCNYSNKNKNYLYSFFKASLTSSNTSSIDINKVISEKIDFLNNTIAEIVTVLSNKNKSIGKFSDNKIKITEKDLFLLESFKLFLVNSSYLANEMISLYASITNITSSISKESNSSNTSSKEYLNLIAIMFIAFFHSINYIFLYFNCSDCNDSNDRNNNEISLMSEIDHLNDYYIVNKKAFYLISVLLIKRNTSGFLSLINLNLLDFTINSNIRSIERSQDIKDVFNELNNYYKDSLLNEQDYKLKGNRNAMVRLLFNNKTKTTFKKDIYEEGDKEDSEYCIVYNNTNIFYLNKSIESSYKKIISSNNCNNKDNMYFNFDMITLFLLSIEKSFCSRNTNNNTNINNSGNSNNALYYNPYITNIIDLFKNFLNRINESIIEELNSNNISIILDILLTITNRTNAYYNSRNKNDKRNNIDYAIYKIILDFIFRIYNTKTKIESSSTSNNSALLSLIERFLNSYYINVSRNIQYLISYDNGDSNSNDSKVFIEVNNNEISLIDNYYPNYNECFSKYFSNNSFLDNKLILITKILYYQYNSISYILDTTSNKSTATTNIIKNKSILYFDLLKSKRKRITDIITNISNSIVNEEILYIMNNEYKELLMYYNMQLNNKQASNIDNKSNNCKNNTSNSQTPLSILSILSSLLNSLNKIKTIFIKYYNLKITQRESVIIEANRESKKSKDSDNNYGNDINNNINNTNNTKELTSVLKLNLYSLLFCNIENTLSFIFKIDIIKELIIVNNINNTNNINNANNANTITDTIINDNDYYCFYNKIINVIADSIEIVEKVNRDFISDSDNYNRYMFIFLIKKLLFFNDKSDNSDKSNERTHYSSFQISTMSAVNAVNNVNTVSTTRVSMNDCHLSKSGNNDSSTDGYNNKRIYNLSSNFIKYLEENILYRQVSNNNISNNNITNTTTSVSNDFILRRNIITNVFVYLIISSYNSSSDYSNYSDCNGNSNIVSVNSIFDLIINNSIYSIENKKDANTNINTDANNMSSLIQLITKLDYVINKIRENTSNISNTNTDYNLLYFIILTRLLVVYSKSENKEESVKIKNLISLLLGNFNNNNINNTSIINILAIKSNMSLLKQEINYKGKGISSNNSNDNDSIDNILNTFILLILQYINKKETNNINSSNTNNSNSSVLDYINNLVAIVSKQMHDDLIYLFNNNTKNNDYLKAKVSLFQLKIIFIIIVLLVNNDYNSNIKDRNANDIDNSIKEILIAIISSLLHNSIKTNNDRNRNLIHFIEYLIVKFFSSRNIKNSNDSKLLDYGMYQDNNDNNDNKELDDSRKDEIRDISKRILGYDFSFEINEILDDIYLLGLANNNYNTNVTNNTNTGILVYYESSYFNDLLNSNDTENSKSSIKSFNLSFIFSSLSIFSKSSSSNKDNTIIIINEFEILIDCLINKYIFDINDKISHDDNDIIDFNVESLYSSINKYVNTKKDSNNVQNKRTKQEVLLDLLIKLTQIIIMLIKIKYSEVDDIENDNNLTLNYVTLLSSFLEEVFILRKSLYYINSYSNNNSNSKVRSNNSMLNIDFTNRYKESILSAITNKEDNSNDNSLSTKNNGLFIINNSKLLGYYYIDKIINSMTTIIAGIYCRYNTNNSSTTSKSISYPIQEINYFLKSIMNYKDLIINDNVIRSNFTLIYKTILTNRIKELEKQINIINYKTNSSNANNIAKDHTDWNLLFNSNNKKDAKGNIANDTKTIIDKNFNKAIIYLTEISRNSLERLNSLSNNFNTADIIEERNSSNYINEGYFDTILLKIHSFMSFNSIEDMDTDTMESTNIDNNNKNRDYNRIYFCIEELINYTISKYYFNNTNNTSNNTENNLYYNTLQFLLQYYISNNLNSNISTIVYLSKILQCNNCIKSNYLINNNHNKNTPYSFFFKIKSNIVLAFNYNSEFSFTIFTQYSLCLVLKVQELLISSYNTKSIKDNKQWWLKRIELEKEFEKTMFLLQEELFKKKDNRENFNGYNKENNSNSNNSFNCFNSLKSYVVYMLNIMESNLNAIIETYCNNNTKNANNTIDDINNINNINNKQNYNKEFFSQFRNEKNTNNDDDNNNSNLNSFSINPFFVNDNNNTENTDNAISFNSNSKTKTRIKSKNKSRVKSNNKSKNKNPIFLMSCNNSDNDSFYKTNNSSININEIKEKSKLSQYNKNNSIKYTNTNNDIGLEHIQEEDTDILTSITKITKIDINNKNPDNLYNLDARDKKSLKDMKESVLTKLIEFNYDCLCDKERIKKEGNNNFVESYTSFTSFTNDLITKYYKFNKGSKNDSNANGNECLIFNTIMILVISPELNFFPLENLPLFNNLIILRSLSNIKDIISKNNKDKGNNETINSNCLLKPLYNIHPNNSYFIINPSGDLINTEKKIGKKLQDYSYIGIKGKTQISNLTNTCNTDNTSSYIYSNYLINSSQNNIENLIYCGHNSGKEVIDINIIRKKDLKLKLSFLMGCGSTSINDNLFFNNRLALDTISYYNKNNCFVVGALWPVTDNDTDAYFSFIIDKFFIRDSKKNSSRSSDEAFIRNNNSIEIFSFSNTNTTVLGLIMAKRKMKFKYLNGAAIVYYR